MAASSMLKPIEFGPEALKYFTGVLAQGRTLSAALLLFDFPGGRFFSYLPESTPPEVAIRFGVGGVASLKETEAAAASFIQDYLGQSGRCAVFEDLLSKAGDPNLASSSVRYFTSGADEVYYYLESGSSRDEIVDALRTATSHALIGVLTRMPDGVTAPARGEKAPPAFLEKCAANAEHVMVGAYDCEGTLIWSANRAG